MWKGKSVSVVFPAYNEEAKIKTAIEEFQVLSYFGGTPIVDEVIVINNNSTDRTEELAGTTDAIVVKEETQGYGNALRRGLGEAKSDLIVLCEPDGTFVATDIIKLLAYADEFDMVFGTRTYPGMVWKDANMYWFLRFVNYFVAKFLEILYGTPSLSDCGCTFRLIHRSKADVMAPDLFVGQSHFLPNMIIAARMNGVRFIEIPLAYRGRIGESKITGNFPGAWNTGMAMIWLIVRMWPGFVWRRIARSKQAGGQESGTPPIPDNHGQ